MYNIYDILNQIDDEASLNPPVRKITENLKKRSVLKESYDVKFYSSRGEKETFETLDSAIKYVNDELHKAEQPSIILYNNNKEMIYLTKDQGVHSANDLGYVVGRQEDDSVVFDKRTGLSIKASEEVDDADVRHSFMYYAQKLGFINEAAFFGKNMKFVKTSKPSYVDFEKKIVYYNPSEQIQKVVTACVDAYRKQKGSLKEYYDEEAPLGRGDLFPGARVKPMEDTVPQWWKDSGRSGSEWYNNREKDREFNKPIRP